MLRMDNKNIPYQGKCLKYTTKIERIISEWISLNHVNLMNIIIYNYYLSRVGEICCSSYSNVHNSSQKKYYIVNYSLHCRSNISIVVDLIWAILQQYIIN